MAQDSGYACCRAASIEELSHHIQTLPTDQLSSHLEHVNALLGLLCSRIQQTLAQNETIDPATYRSANDCGDGDTSNSEGGEEQQSHVDEQRQIRLGKENHSRLVPAIQPRKKYRCQYKCRSFTRRQELVRHYLRHLECKTPCPTCSIHFPTANLFIKHKCFKNALDHQQREQLASYRGEIEEKFDLRPPNRRVALHSNSRHPITNIPETALPRPTSVEATEGGLSNHASLHYTSGLSVLPESNHMGVSEGIYDSSQLHLDPSSSSFDTQQHILLTYVENRFDPHNWNAVNFQDQDRRLAN